MLKVWEKALYHLGARKNRWKNKQKKFDATTKHKKNIADVKACFYPFKSKGQVAF
jgi:hypothetical protein